MQRLCPDKRSLYEVCGADIQLSTMTCCAVTKPGRDGLADRNFASQCSTHEARAATHNGCVVARCTYSSIFLECSPNFYPVEWPPQNHTQGPNFCTLQLLLVYQEFLIFSPMLVTGPRVPISPPCSSCVGVDLLVGGAGGFQHPLLVWGALPKCPPMPHRTGVGGGGGGRNSQHGLVKKELQWQTPTPPLGHTRTKPLDLPICTE